MVWAVVKRRMNWDQVNNIEDAKGHLIRHWNNLPQPMLAPPASLSPGA
jgi:hypothetical protein